MLAACGDSGNQVSANNDILEKDHSEAVPKLKDKLGIRNTSA